MKILLFGKNGQVGWELQRSLQPLGQVIALGSNSSDLCGDFTDLKGVSNTIKQVKPDVIVNAAAYTAVDKAESEPQLAHRINADAPGVLAHEAALSDAWLIHYSTDYVFDGGGTKPWTEADATSPLNIYGKTKLAGEEAIRDSGCKHLIFRTSWVYAARGNNFAKTMLRLAQERDGLSVIDDQVGAPTGGELLADVTSHAIRAARKNSSLQGIYHLVAAGDVSWHGYAAFVLNFAREMGMDLKVLPEAIRAIPSSEFPAPARRPKNSCLNSSKLEKSFNLTLPSWQSGVARMLTEILEK
ncbi:dTDP-4-dehydrorhamnose reductase [Methylomarinum sp. Ch1-1]|uniref:dTDP-4-dehydrorhamnose reductase n=1 Tax=Methylomarinum roseum TaxID=3067653 RepID=A0AAU7NW10_9GAMM|nr:dTDP-4-dehydrorhamnose reductase [Methylomarinum sp. Ch1-1]MDP4522845.1 dTDP-4-dehydrorhamnose reductase [Methylomarinum sp. Ch1-1]